MSPVDGVAAAYTLLARGTGSPGYCLYYVWLAYKAHGAATSRNAPTAFTAWERSDGQHPGDRNPPPGVPVFWGQRSWGSNPLAGDVTISLGGGRIAATDWPYNGVIGETTIDERERQIGRPYLGWTECIFDVPIALGSTAGGDSTDFPARSQEEDDPMLMLIIGGAHLASLSESGTFRHFTKGDPTELIKNLERSADDWQNVSFADLPALLYTHGCDTNIWDVRDGSFVVVDPLRGTVASGNAWSPDKATRAAIAKIAQPVVDPTPIVEAVKAAIKANPIDVDEEAIANAVAAKLAAVTPPKA